MNEEIFLTEEKNIIDNLKIKQEKFLSSSMGKIINNALDIGLRAVLPDLIENEIINVKDTILENGFSEGIKEIVLSTINFGKSAIGIVTGEFENINQIDLAIKKGGIIDSVSDLLDFTIKKANEKGIIDNSISSLIKNGKNTILKEMSKRIENSLETQIKSLEKLQSYCNKWNESYKNQDFKSMEKAYKNVEKYLEKTVPFEKTIKEARKIENLHNLIKNNRENFNITENEKKLAEILIK